MSIAMDSSTQSIQTNEASDRTTLPYFFSGRLPFSSNAAVIENEAFSSLSSGTTPTSWNWGEMTEICIPASIYKTLNYE